jgi:hypothetical protein
MQFQLMPTVSRGNQESDSEKRNEKASDSEGNEKWETRTEWIRYRLSKTSIGNNHSQTLSGLRPGRQSVPGARRDYKIIWTRQWVVGVVN